MGNLDLFLGMDLQEILTLHVYHGSSPHPRQRQLHRLRPAFQDTILRRLAPPPVHDDAAVLLARSLLPLRIHTATVSRDVAV